MTIEEQLEMRSYGSLFFLVILPMLIVLLAPRLFRLRSRLLRFSLAVIVSWIGVEWYDGTFIRPLSFNLAMQAGDDLYDGTGAGAATLVLGFVLPSIFSLIALGIEAAKLRHRSR